ncbi:MAG: metallophosphatase family protein [Bacteroidales bacterium]|nr:metallophosphoesterase family protein [Candidatus Cryptobacteroides onthequi]MCQ2165062.1 metallophosphatase family protein [Bacteroidales bacterium]
MFVGLISDTHGVFDREFRDFLAPVDQVWHAGDFGGGTSTEEEIASFKPLLGVYGNCDGQDIRFDCPEYRFFTCGGMTVLMMHIGGYPGRYDRRAKELIEKYRPQLFVCGHSHILKVMYDKKYEMMTVNPGACGIQGWHAVRTALRFHIDGGQLHDMEVMNLPRKTSL